MKHNLLKYACTVISILPLWFVSDMHTVGVIAAMFAVGSLLNAISDSHYQGVIAPLTGLFAAAYTFVCGTEVFVAYTLISICGTLGVLAAIYRGLAMVRGGDATPTEAILSTFAYIKIYPSSLPQLDTFKLEFPLEEGKTLVIDKSTAVYFETTDNGEPVVVESKSLNMVEKFLFTDAFTNVRNTMLSLNMVTADSK